MFIFCYATFSSSIILVRGCTEAISFVFVGEENKSRKYASSPWTLMSDDISDQVGSIEMKGLKTRFVASHGKKLLVICNAYSACHSLTLSNTIFVHIHTHNKMLQV
jgi:hypothetical protein